MEALRIFTGHTAVVEVQYNLIHIFKNVQRNCAHPDWSERVHYISIKHICYVTQAHCQDIIHAAYVISTSAHNPQYIL